MPQAYSLVPQVGRVFLFLRMINSTTRPTHLWSFSSQWWTESTLDGKRPSSIEPAWEPQGLNHAQAFGMRSRGRQHTMSWYAGFHWARLFSELCQSHDSQHWWQCTGLNGKDYNADHDYKLEVEECKCHPIAFHTKIMGDILYLHQALQQDDSPKFVKAIIKEVNSHVDEMQWNSFHGLMTTRHRDNALCMGYEMQERSHHKPVY